MANLAILCPNCHKMHDLDLISTETIIEMRDRSKIPVWKKRMKNAGPDAAKTRMENEKRRKRQRAAQKAVATREENSRKRLLESSNASTKKDQREAPAEAKA